MAAQVASRRIRLGLGVLGAPLGDLVLGVFVLAGGVAGRYTRATARRAERERREAERVRRSAALRTERARIAEEIGSGVLTTAFKKGLIGEADLAGAVAVMIELNRGARDAAVEVGVHAVTDITGFGLVGHAFGMASASEVTLEIEAAAVPLLTG